MDAQRQAAEQLGVMIDDVKNTRRGAFAPLAQQPLVRAVLVPLSGASGLALLQYFFLLGR